MPGLSVIVYFSLLFWNISQSAVATFQCEDGKVSFVSDAPLEIIKAESAQLRGLIRPEDRSFAWRVSMRSFSGFNSALQQEHFYENYIETDQFPFATFNGKIIEQIDFEKDGDYQIRAKGKLVLHGIEQERIIKSRLQIKNGKAMVRSEFSVLLSDHDIDIPKIVSQKIATEIQVKVDAVLEPKP